jgi:hypothetical protein
MSTNLLEAAQVDHPSAERVALSAHRRRIALLAAIETLRTRFGPTIIRQVGDLSAPPPGSDRFPLSTGSLGLDLLTGGLPRATISEYGGLDGSGRETLAAVAVARAQAAGGLTVLVDPGSTADPDALTAAGIDLAALTLAYPGTVGQACSIVEVLCRCGAADLLLINSFSGLLLLPNPGGAVRPGRLLARWRLSLRGRRTSLLLINHAVTDQPWSTVEERAVAQESGLRVGLSGHGVRLDAHGIVGGLCTEARVIKHLGRPHWPAIELLMQAGGPDRGRELLTLARLTDCLEETPLGLLVGNRYLGRSLRHAALILREDRDLATMVEEHIRASWSTSQAMSPALLVTARR